MNDSTTLSDLTLKHRAQFRAAGVIILALGIGSACLLYWLRTRGLDSSNDPMLAEYSKPEARQMAILYGKMGQATSDLFEALKQPGTQAFLIVAVSALVAMGCFFFARRWVDVNETEP